MNPGDRVHTPQGPGTVVYVRLGVGERYLIPQAISVRLDSQAGRPGYVGTIFDASEVTRWVQSV